MISSGSHCVATLICNRVRHKSQRGLEYRGRRNIGKDLLKIKNWVRKKEDRGCGECNIQMVHLK